MRRLIRRHGACDLSRSRHEGPFHALVQAIVSQQLSTRAAATIIRRVLDLCGGAPTPTILARLTDADLRTAGLSGQKVRYVRDLAARVRAGTLRLEGLDTLDDGAVIDALTAVTGIGRWTAEMFLIFRLQRADVLPVGDLGILRAVQQNYGLRQKPTPARLLALGEPWKPYRSVASWYLWASLDNADGEE